MGACKHENQRTKHNYKGQVISLPTNLTITHQVTRKTQERVHHKAQLVSYFSSDKAYTSTN